MNVPRLHVIVNGAPAAERALDGGMPTASGQGGDTAPLALQVRIKQPGQVTDTALLAETRQVVEVARRSGAAVLVNDRADVALAAAAAGVHGGAEDLPTAELRRLVGPDLLVGATARDAATARRRQYEGASYVGVGPVYATRSKHGLPDPVGPATLTAVAEAVDVPVIAIGGVTTERVPELLAAGAWGVAVIAAVADAADPAAAVRELLEALNG